MIGNGKSVGFITDALQQEQGSGVWFEYDWILTAGEKDTFGRVADFFGERVSFGSHLR